MKHYYPIQKQLHWISALLILALFSLGVWMRSLDYYNPWYQQAPDLHKSIGVLLMAIIIMRMLTRGLLKSPSPLSSHRAWEIKAAHIVHLMMYALITTILVSGYLIATADNRGIEVFSIFELPALFTPFEEQEDIAGLIHEWGAYTLITLVIMHVAGALKHHFIDKDETLKRML